MAEFSTLFLEDVGTSGDASTVSLRQKIVLSVRDLSAGIYRLITVCVIFLLPGTNLGGSYVLPFLSCLNKEGMPLVLE